MLMSPWNTQKQRDKVRLALLQTESNGVQKIYEQNKDLVNMVW